MLSYQLLPEHVSGGSLFPFLYHNSCTPLGWCWIINSFSFFLLWVPPAGVQMGFVVCLGDWTRPGQHFANHWYCLLGNVFLGHSTVLLENLFHLSPLHPPKSHSTALQFIIFLGQCKPVLNPCTHVHMNLPQGQVKPICVCVWFFKSPSIFTHLGGFGGWASQLAPIPTGSKSHSPWFRPPPSSIPVKFKFKFHDGWAHLSRH